MYRASIGPICATELLSLVHAPDRQFSWCPTQLSLCHLYYPRIRLIVQSRCTTHRKRWFWTSDAIRTYKGTTTPTDGDSFKVLWLIFIKNLSLKTPGYLDHSGLASPQPRSLWYTSHLIKHACMLYPRLRTCEQTNSYGGLNPTLGGLPGWHRYRLLRE